MASLLLARRGTAAMCTLSCGRDKVGFKTLRLDEPFGRGETLRTQEFRVVEPRLIARTRVAEHRDDVLDRAGLEREADRAGHVHSGGQTEDQAFLLVQCEG